MKALVWLFLLCASGARAQTDSGRAGHAYDLLLEPSSARAAALGQAYESLAEGPQGWLYNPAGAGSGPMQLGLDHENWLAGATRQRLSLGAGGFAGQYHLLSLPSSERRDAQGQRQGSFQGRDWSLGLAASRSLFSGLELGVALDWLSQDLPQQSQQDYSLSLGLLAGRGGPWSLGLTLRERPAASPGEQRRLITGALAGAARFKAWGEQAWVLGLSLKLDPEAPGEYALGLEWPLRFGGLQTALRGGWSLQVPDHGSGRGNQGSLGAGLAWGAWSLDYAFLPLGADLGATHQWSLSWQLQPTKPLSAAPTPLSSPPLPSPPPSAALAPHPRLSTEFKVLSDGLVEAQELEKAGRAQEAFKAYRLVVQSDPKDREAWLGLARLYRTMGREDYARQAEAQAP